jgi:ParB-like chromosome segregation protein Spo0J
MAKKNISVPDLSELKIEYISIKDLIPYARNSRTHSDLQIAQIAASMQEFGWTNPVLIDKDGVIIAGHGRVMAGMKLNLETAPCIVLGNLTDTQKRAYVIADNKLALNAGWDAEMLSVELDTLRDEKFDLSLLGFENQEINDLIGTPNIPPELTQEDENEEESGNFIKLEFDEEHIEEAKSLVTFWEKQGAYVGYMLIDYLKQQKGKI